MLSILVWWRKRSIRYTYHTPKTDFDEPKRVTLANTLMVYVSYNETLLDTVTQNSTILE